MLALVVVVLAGLLMVQLSQDSMDYAALESYVRAKYQREHMIAIAEGVESYYQERGTFPASLQALASTAGYQELRTAIELNMGYVASGTLNDGTWRFNRTVAYMVPQGSKDTVTTYPNSNYCGTGPITTALSWCGDQNSLYFRRETRDTVNEELITQRVRLNRLQQKFARYYNANQKYPDKDGSNNSLAASSINSFADLVGFTGTAANCAGPFQYMGIPIDCGDIFDRWGNRVGYQFESSAHVIFVSESPFINASGEQVIVAVDRM
jgi:hypothetical protein